MSISKLRTKRRGLIEKSRGLLGADDVTAEDVQAAERMHDEIEALDNSIRQSEDAIPRARRVPAEETDTRENDRDEFSGAGSAAFHDQAGNVVRTASHGEPLARPGDSESFSLGRFVRGMITGNRADLNDTEQRALQVGTDAEGGYLVGDEFSNRFIDLSRANMVVSKAGAQTVQMNSGELIMAKATADASPGWYGENQTIGESEPTFGQVKFTARKMACIARVSRELVEDAENVSGLIEDLLAKAVAQELDRVALLGDGDGAEPVGVFNTDGIQTEGSVGSPTFDDFLNAAYNIENENGMPGAVILHPATANTLRQLKDSAGQYLMPPKGYTDLKQHTTTALASSQAVVGDFSKLMIGIRGGVQLTATGDASTAFAKDQVLIKVRWRGDVQLAGKASHFSTLEGIS